MCLESAYEGGGEVGNHSGGSVAPSIRNRFALRFTLHVKGLLRGSLTQI